MPPGRDAHLNLSATNKAGEAEFTLWDVLDDAENDQGETKEDTHYAIAKELDDAIKANLTLTMHDNTKLTYAQAVEAGNTITIKMTYYAQKTVPRRWTQITRPPVCAASASM